MADNENYEFGHTLDAWSKSEEAKQKVEITGVMLRKDGGDDSGGGDAVVLVEVDGVWHEAIREDVNGCFSHIASASGIRNGPIPAWLNR